MIYIDERIDQLKKIDITKYFPQDREAQKEQLNGRIFELQTLKRSLQHNRIKRDAKRMFENNHANDKSACQSCVSHEFCQNEEVDTEAGCDEWIEAHDEYMMAYWICQKCSGLVSSKKELTTCPDPLCQGVLTAISEEEYYDHFKGDAHHK